MYFAFLFSFNFIIVINADGDLLEKSNLELVPFLGMRTQHSWECEDTTFKGKWFKYMCWIIFLIKSCSLWELFVDFAHINEKVMFRTWQV